jgi:hypothetical protein
MGKLNRRKTRRVKPVDKTIHYYTNVLKIVADGAPKKSENEIYNALQALDISGLNDKWDALNTIHNLSENQILKISKSENHSQKYDVQLAPLGDELVSFQKNVERTLMVYKDVERMIREHFVLEEDITYEELKAKLLSRNWKLEDIPSHDQWLGKVLDFMIKTPFAIILTLITSYVRLLPKINNNVPAKAILDNVFSVGLKQGLSSQIRRQEIPTNDALAQMELPLIQYFADYFYDKDLHENELLGRKPKDLLNSIYSIIEPGRDMNFNNLLKYILTLKEKNIPPTPQDLQLFNYL